MGPRRGCVLRFVLCCLFAWSAMAAVAQTFSITDIFESGGVYRIRFESGTNFYNVLIRGDTLTNLVDEAGMNFGQAVSNEFEDAGGGPEMFYLVERIAIADEQDRDGDGIGDVYELNRPFLDPLDAADANEDFDNDLLSNVDEFNLGTDPAVSNTITTVESTSPAHGEQDVAVTRETVFRLSHPLSMSSSVDTQRLFATFGGDGLPGRVQVSSDRDTITLFYDDPLPASARVRITLIGDGLLDENGLDVDVDADHFPGGTLEFDFDTLTLTVISNTIACGRVFASEPVSTNMAPIVNQPLEGVTITVDGMESELFAVTDHNGDFRIDPAPAGRFFVHIDGSTASNPVPQTGYYPTVGKAFESIPSQEVNIGDIFLPLIIDGTLQEASTDQVTMVTFPDSVISNNPAFVNVVLAVPADSLYSDDGSRGGSIGIAPVDPARLPGPLPPGLDLSLVITVQTDGPTNFDEPASVCFPNVDGLPPGAKSALWSFNHDAGRWEIVGSMTVTTNGELVCTDPGVGIRAPGWHGQRVGSEYKGGVVKRGDKNKKREPPTSETPPSSTCREGSCVKQKVVDRAYPFSGESVEMHVDMFIKGIGLDFTWARKYRSKVGPNTSQGNGWDSAYNISIRQDGPDLMICDGNSREDRYLLQPDGTYTASGYFRSLEMNPNESFTLAFADTGQWNFNALDESPAAGKLDSIVDRNGNTMSFSYDAFGRLVTVNDTLGRDIVMAYNPDGFVESVTDFTGRQMTYAYYQDGDSGGSFGDLKSVTGPAVTGTPNGNDFPNGKTWTYTYTTGFADERLNHNLLTITDARGQIILNNEYASTEDPDDITFDRLVRQVLGDPGDITDFTYARITPVPENHGANILVTVNDRVGNVDELLYDPFNLLRIQREYTGRADPDLPTTETENRPQNKLRPSDPDVYETHFKWTPDFLPQQVIRPNGNVTEFVYGRDLDPGASQIEAGNLREIHRMPGPLGGDQAIITEEFEYDSGLSSCCGNHFVTRHVDGRGNEKLYYYDTNGNRTQSQDRISSVIEDLEYNAFGQLIARVSPDNGNGHRRRDEYTYYVTGPQAGYMMKRIVDAPNLALTTTYEYDSRGNIVREIDPRGNDRLYNVNQLDQVVHTTSREVDPGGSIRYARDTFYDANDNVIRVDIENINGQGVLQPNTQLTTTYEYEILNFLTGKVYEVNSTDTIRIEHRYDGNRNRVLTRFGEAVNGNQPANVVQTLYDERDLIFQETRAPGDPTQSTTQYDYDANGNLFRVSEGVEDGAHVSLHVYDGFDRIENRSDPMGNRTEYDYDENDNVVSMRRDGEVTDIVGDSNNVRLAEGAYTFDAMDRLTLRERFYFDTSSQLPIADGTDTTSYVYSDNSQILVVENDNNHMMTTDYDTVNRRSQQLDPKGNAVTYTYDENSNLTGTTETDKSDLGSPDEIFVSTFEYDGLDRLSKSADNVSNTLEYTYDSRGNLVELQDAIRPAPTDPGNRTEYVYDGINRLNSTIRYLTADGTGTGAPSGQITTQQIWDDSSRLAQLIDDRGNATTYTYDALNRRTATTYADSTGYLKVFDAHDTKTSMTDANGNTATYMFDLLDRLTRKDVVPAAGVSADTTFEDYAYDGLSRLVRAEDDDSIVTRAYDSLSNLTRETLNGQNTDATYDGVGNMLSCTYPGGRVITCTFDELERKATAGDGAGFSSAYDFIGPGRVERLTYGNNTRCDVTYDGVKRVTQKQYTHQNGGTTVLDDWTFDWDQAYNKASRANQLPGGLTHDYTYDSIYRMTQSVTEPTAGGAAETIDYALDGAGNRTQVTGGPDAGAYVLDNTLPQPADSQVNQYTATPLDARSNDDNGNLTAKSVTSYDYDYANRLVSAGTGTTYRYDALRRRIQKDVGGIVTRYFYSDLRVCEEQNGAGATQATYVYGHYIDEVLNMQRGGTDYVFHCDDLYNVTTVTDPAGAVVEKYEYEDYGTPSFFDGVGTPLAGTQIGNPYLFTGRRYDPETEFYYYRTRYLDSHAGRFISRDGDGQWSDPRNIGNGQAYAANNPSTLVDPMGRNGDRVVDENVVSSGGDRWVTYERADGSKYSKFLRAPAAKKENQSPDQTGRAPSRDGKRCPARETIESTDSDCDNMIRRIQNASEVKRREMVKEAIESITRNIAIIPIRKDIVEDGRGGGATKYFAGDANLSKYMLFFVPIDATSVLRQMEDRTDDLDLTSLDNLQERLKQCRERLRRMFAGKFAGDGFVSDDFVDDGSPIDDDDDDDDDDYDVDFPDDDFIL